MKNKTGCSRRRFLTTTLSSSAILTAATLGHSESRGPGDTPGKIAFVTANLVARVSNYRFELAHWGEQHKKTVAATDAAAWRSICSEIAAHGFTAVEIWEAHAAPEVMDRDRGATWKSILDDHGLKAIGYGGGLSRKTLEICQWLDIPQINGGIGENTPDQATVLCKEAGVRFNVENHPQKTAQELLNVIGGGNDWLGVCIDTGWLGTQGVSGPEIIRACGPLVRHTHIKDVKAAGGHETCLLGEGVAQVADCIAALKEGGYSGWYSWEDEPEDRNPFDSAVRNRQWIDKQLGQESFEVQGCPHLEGVVMITSFILIAVALGAGPSEVPSPLPPLAAGEEWRLVWHDEFDASILDESKWERIDGPRREAFWSKDDAYLDGKGCLVLRTRKDGDRYTSGAVRTKGKFEHRYGFWECRCQFPEQQGHWPAFWLMPVEGLKDAEAGGAAGTEIDVMEKAYQIDKMNHALHWDGYGSHHKSDVRELEGLGLNEGFHTFGLWWTPEEYVFYVDGKETWRTKGGGPSQALSYAKLTEEIGPWAGKITEAALPDYFVVDYVRVYDPVQAGSDLLRDVHRIVFLGDSITQAGDYVADIDCWLVSRGADVEVLNLGLGSETASDLTEDENAGHKNAFGFGRPSVSERLDRVLTETRPDILFACYGMNDGGALPLDESGVARFTAAIANLRETALKAGVRRVVLCTPPVHDAKGNEALKTHDGNLTRYSEWLLSKKGDGWDVVDIHGPMRKALDEGRAKDAGFALAGDGVHPGREGHWLMAKAVLEQFFGANVDDISSADQLFRKNGEEIRGLIRQRMDTLFGAWMTKIGHNRPGVTGGPDVAPGPSIDEAGPKVVVLSKQIAELREETPRQVPAGK